jgi:hypothetical protein
VTLIQRYGSALNLNIHFHILLLDGANELTAVGPRFRRVTPPTPAAFEALLGTIVTRIAQHLERRGLVVRDAENSYLSSGPGEEAGLEALLGHSITYRIAVGPGDNPIGTNRPGAAGTPSQLSTLSVPDSRARGSRLRLRPGAVRECRPRARISRRAIECRGQFT